MRHRRLVLLPALLFAQVALAQHAAPATSESRDAASAYIGTGNFIVARIGRECLALVGRPESPQDFVANWQHRNAPFVKASARYMDARVAEAEASGGPERRAAVLRDLRAAVQGGGEAAVRSLLQGRKEESCMRAITLVDGGALDISPKVPIYDQIEALVRWAEQ
jgi:hypothetical protein